VILLGSNNEHFTAGNDLADFLANPSIDPDSSVYQFLTALMHCPLPVVAAVQGFAIGIGSTLLLHCEQVFAHTSARFSFPFINLGLVPEAGSTLLLPQLTGYQKAADLLLLGEVFSAEEALKIGFVAHVLQDNVQESAFSYAQQLAQKPRASLMAIKKLLRRDTEALSVRSDFELATFIECLNSAPAKEAMSAFLEKRKPNFSNI
jgi:enoyl-CoA hydratase/carnithine racemase